jgi:oligopeptide transport system ATP-binding protein
VHTIGEQISEALIHHQRMDKREALRKTVQMLEFVGIPSPERRVREHPYQLSGGMRQRVMIAMALSCNPSLLIADEPTTALDVTIQAQIIDLAKRLRDKLGMAMIWITHDLGIVAGLVDRVIVMYAGFIVEKADVDELYANPRHPYTLGLLRSLPRVDKDRIADERLIPIPGLPPDLIGLPPGCPFVARGPFSVPPCAAENPVLKKVSYDHEVACWVDVREAVTHEVVA